MTRHHVIVGSGIAALSAAESIRHADAQARITMVSPEPLPFYSRPGLAYLLTDEVPESRLAIRTPAEVRALQLIHRPRTATVLLPDRYCVILDDGERLEYDRPPTATGAPPIRPPPPGGRPPSPPPPPPPCPPPPPPSLRPRTSPSPPFLLLLPVRKQVIAVACVHTLS